MNSPNFARILIAFLLAVLLATVWGAVVQTQYNLAGVASVGGPIDAGVRIQTTFSDIFSGFTPTYAGYVVLPSLLVAFLAAWLLATRTAVSPLLWFGLAGFVAILAGNPIVNALSPLALLVGATRDFSCLLLMSVGGAVAGLLFAVMVFPRSPSVADTPAQRRAVHGNQARDLPAPPPA